ncbi:MAG: DUF445 domain-containing protein [Actinomycetota bacterium]|nr:DUF445 domain-containing protein [Actinomycetota bacterium]
MVTAPTVPPLASPQGRERQLVVTRRRATALLAAVALVFVAVTAFGGDAGWVGYVQSTAEASLIGGLADWFAVTALFRHPLGVPVPHTAIVVERKDQFGKTLGEFVQESFLTPESILERVRAAGVVPRLAAWLVQGDNAARVAGHLADAAVAGSDLVADDDIERGIEGIIRERLAAVPLSPLAGRALGSLMEGGRHHELVDAAVTGLERYLDQNRDELRLRLGQSSPWWLPEAVEDRIFERLVDGGRTVLQEMARDRGHRLRRALDDRLAGLATELERSPELRARGEQLKREILSQQHLGEWVASLWRDAKRELLDQAGDPDGELRRRLAATVVAAGERLGSDPVLAARLQDGLESAVRFVAEHFHDEIASLVSGTIARWDGEETSRRLELLLGPDLQYIRINGTVVGGAAGLILHAGAQAVG